MACRQGQPKEKAKRLNAFEVAKPGKQPKDYAHRNEASKAFRQHVCQTTAKLRATGKVTEVGGKPEFTAAKIALDQ